MSALATATAPSAGSPLVGLLLLATMLTVVVGIPVIILILARRSR